MLRTKTDWIQGSVQRKQNIFGPLELIERSELDRKLNGDIQGALEVEKLTAARRA